MFGFGKSKKAKGSRRTVVDVTGVRIGEVVAELDGLRSANLADAQARVEAKKAEIAKYEEFIKQTEAAHQEKLNTLNAELVVFESEAAEAERWLKVFGELKTGATEQAA